MSAGRVDVLVIVGGNPVYTAPADIAFADAMSKVALRVHLSLYDDETSALCHWQIPEAHFLEAWSDARALRRHGVDRPAADRAALRRQVGARAARRDERPAGAIRLRHRARVLEPHSAGSRVRRTVRARWSGRGAHNRRQRRLRRRSLRQGRRSARSSTRRGAAGCTTAWCRTPPFPRSVSVRSGVGRPGESVCADRFDGGGAGLEIVFRNDPSVLDGRFANNGWLQELPKPITRLTWDNAVLRQPGNGRAAEVRRRPSVQGGEHGQIVSNVVELRYRGRTVRGARLRRRRPPGRLRRRCISATAGRGPGRSAPAPASTRTRSARRTRRGSAAGSRSSTPATPIRSRARSTTT